MVNARVTIDLDVFEDEDLRMELEKRGYTVLALDRIEHLLNCGMRAEARAELVEAASRVLGRPL